MTSRHLSQRRQSTPTYSPSPTSNRRNNQDYYDSDTEEEKGTKQDQVYHGACSLGRFCLNPCLCLATTATRVLCCRSEVGGSSRARRTTSSSQDKQWKRTSIVKGILMVLTFCVFLFSPRRNGRSLRHKTDWALETSPLLIKLFDFADVNDLGGWHYPAANRFLSTTSLEPLQYVDMSDYNGLLFASLKFASPSKFRRKIAPDDDVSYETNRQKFVLEMDETFLREVYDHFEERLDKECRTPNFASLYFPTCNSFHELDVARDYDRVEPSDLSYYDSYLFAHGYYRDAWMLNHADSKETTKSNNSILKTLRFEHDFSIKDYFGIQKDALVMERLSSSPRILPMHGHCSMSMLVRPMPYEVEKYVVPGSGMAEQKELEMYNDVKPMNEFNVSEKLGIALEMAESLADLHGYSEGIIVHDDVQLCQWLRSYDNKLLLGDFNRAEVMEWNEKNKSYCKYKNGYVYGNYRSPEEMRNDYIDEKIDIYSFGNNLYGLLTGLWVFYENDDDKVVQEKVSEGQRAFIDDRYRNHTFGEGKLVELMERCWIEDPRERIDIFEAVRFLREAIKENKERTE